MPGDLFFPAVVSVRTGKRFYGGLVYRAQDPSESWWLVAIYFLGAVLFIGRLLKQRGTRPASSVVA